MTKDTALDNLDTQVKELGKKLISGIKGDEYKETRHKLTSMKEVLDIGKKAYTRQDLTPFFDSVLDDLEKTIEKNEEIISSSLPLLDSLNNIIDITSATIENDKILYQKLSIIKNSIIEVEEINNVESSIKPDPRIVKSFEELYGRNTGRQMLRDKGYNI